MQRSAEETGAATARLWIVLTAILFSTGGAAVKACALTGWQVAGFRSGIAALAVLAMLPAARRGWSWRAVLVGAVYGTTLVLFVLANKLTTAANTIFLQSTAPLYALLLGPWLLKEPVRRRDVTFLLALGLGLALFFVGVESPSDSAPDPLRGNLLGAGAGLFWALTLTGLRWLGREEGGSAAPAVVAGNLLAFLACIPAGLPLGPVRPADAALLAYLGIFQIGLAYVLLTAGLRHTPVLEASLLLLLEPVLNPLWAWMFQREAPAGWSLAGCAVILAATALRTWLEHRRSSRPRTAGGAPRTL